MPCELSLAGHFLLQCIGAVKLRGRFHHDFVAGELNVLISNDFAAFTGFNFAVDLDLAFSNHRFRGTAAVTPAHKFEQVAQFYVRVFFEKESFHVFLTYCVVQIV
jgi:hypothetical protein